MNITNVILCHPRINMSQSTAKTAGTAKTADKANTADKAKTADKANKGFFGGLFGSNAADKGKAVDTGAHYRSPTPALVSEVEDGAWEERPPLPDGYRTGY